MTRILQAAFVLALTLNAESLLSADEVGDGPDHRWQLVRQHCDAGLVRPLAGKTNLSRPIPLKFDVASPGAALFQDQGSAATFLKVKTDDISRLLLPDRQFTAEAWVRVDKPLEWGGVFGIIEDNGDYERGWLLGYRKSQFFFALATEKKRRLTYLQSPVLFEPGSWYHIAGVWDGKVQSLFIDGKPVATSREQGGAVVYPDDLGTAHFGVGGYLDKDESHPLTGEIEQVSLWNRPLSASELSQRFADRKSHFPGIEASHPEVVDWPTHRRDNQRTGLAKETTVPFPLHLQWVHRTGKKPAPAWPAPAQHDFWNRKHNLKPRVTFDRACPLVAVGNAVVYSSSSEDKVVCLDADTGEVRWQAFAEAPVRLAPTIDRDRVLFGADDGYVYCVRGDDGSLLWKRRPVEQDRQIVGNGRMISVWPIRTGILVDDGKAFFCAGLFPEQQVFQAAVDVTSGRLLGKAAVRVSPQGYLERQGSRLHVATGRDPAGAFVSTLTRRGKGVGKEIRSIPSRYPYAFIGDARSRFGGGSGEVAAFDASTGEKVWEAEVDGNAWIMAIAGSRLLVSTDEGVVYSFGSTPVSSESPPSESQQRRQPKSDDQVEAAQTAQQIRQQLTDVKGWALILNPGRGHLATALSECTEYNIVCLESDAAAADVLRRSFDRVGLAGRISVHTSQATDKLPYSDYLFNLVVDSDAILNPKQPRSTNLPFSEAERVTRPSGGIALLGPAADDVFQRGPLDEIGEWTHQYADAGNTVCSGDRRVRGRMKLQWFGAPGPRGMMDRHHRAAAPLWANGRIIIPGDNRIDVADAYNGTPLWSAAIPESRRAGVYRDTAQLAVSGDSVYVAAADTCLSFNAADGKEQQRFALPDDKSSATTPKEWGYVATVDDLLFGTVQKKGSSRRDHSREQIEEGTYFDARPLVCSDSVFALDRRSGKVFWHYRPKNGSIVNPTIAVADGRMCFLESTAPATADAKIGRHKAADLFQTPPLLTALDMRTGRRLWQKPLDLSHIQHTIYVCAARNRIVVHGSFNRNAGDKPRVHVDVSVFDAESGQPMWRKVQNNGTETGGSHGEQDLHPVIVDNGLYCEPFAYNLDTGSPLSSWKWTAGSRRGCGTMSASAAAFFFRHTSPTMFEPGVSSYSKVTSVTRPGCWINMIPAGGLLLIPEASSGCSCDFAVQSSTAFLPVSGE